MGRTLSSSSTSSSSSSVSVSRLAPSSGLRRPGSASSASRIGTSAGKGVSAGLSKGSLANLEDEALEASERDEEEEKDPFDLRDTDSRKLTTEAVCSLFLVVSERFEVTDTIYRGNTDGFETRV